MHPRHPGRHIASDRQLNHNFELKFNEGSWVAL